MATTAMFDNDALTAATDLVGRSGARELEIGYLHDDVPSDQAGWYATATYQGAKITEEDHKGPVEAAEALARRILLGAKCAHCQGLVALGDGPTFAFAEAAMADGTKWKAEEAAAAGRCRWTRHGDRWVRGCETPEPRPNRATRRRGDNRRRR